MRWWENPAYSLAAIAWASVFALSWLMVLRGSNEITFGFWGFFMLVALGASAVANQKGNRSG